MCDIVDHLAPFKQSKVGRDAFGDDAHFHLAHSADAEWKAFHDATTDWEWHRNFERI